jgi:hypothetical protein
MHPRTSWYCGELFLEANEADRGAVSLEPCGSATWGALAGSSVGDGDGNGEQVLNRHDLFLACSVLFKLQPQATETITLSLRGTGLTPSTLRIILAIWASRAALHAGPLCESSAPDNKKGAHRSERLSS